MFSSRTRDSYGPMAVTLLVAAFLLLLLTRFAHAAPDLVSTLAPAAGTAWDTFASSGPYWAAILSAYLLLQTFLSKQHWLAQGRLLSVLTGLGMVLTAVTQWHFEGAPSAGILTAAMAAFTLILHPIVPATMSKRDPQSGMVGGNMMAGLGTLAVILVVSLVGGYFIACTPGSTARQTTASAVVAALDCELLHVDADVVSDARLFADAKVQGWLSGVKPGDTAALEARIAADLKPIRSDLGRCSVAGALAAIAVALTPQPGTAVSALSAGDPVQLRAAFAVAARQAGWAPVKVAGGVTL